MKKSIIFLAISFIISTINYLYSTVPAFSVERYEILQSYQLTAPGGFSHPCVYDWNQDGKKDLIVSAGNFKIYIYFNTGSDSNPEFTHGEELTLNNQELLFGAHPYAYISTNSDFNGDGKDDLMITVEGEVFVYTNRDINKANINNEPIQLIFSGNKTHFGEDDPYANAIGSYHKSGAVITVNFNNDGLVDIFSSYRLYSSQGVYVMRLGFYTNSGTPSEPSFTNGIIIVYTNQSTPYTPPGYYEVCGSWNDPFAIYVDWNNNGTNDILFGYTTLVSVGVSNTIALLNASHKEYSFIKWLKGKNLFTTNTDGKPIVLFSPPGNPLVDSNYSPINFGFNVKPIVCDWDNDGTKDVVVGEYIGNIRIYKQLNSLQISLQTNIGFNGVIQQKESCELYLGDSPKITILDWNNDGVKDIFASSGWYGRNYYYINYGTDLNPIFKEGKIIMDGNGATIVRGIGNYAYTTIYDINGDGKKDLIMGGESTYVQSKIAIYTNKGTDSNPLFSSSPFALQAGGNDISIFNDSVYFKDYNNDGKVDIIIAGLDGKIRVGYNTGVKDDHNVPIYSELQLITYGKEKNPIVGEGLPTIPNIIDFDNDGKKDIIYAAGSKIVYWLNQGTDSEPYFETKNILKFDRALLNTGEYSIIYVLDYNGDGWHDIFLGNTSDKIYKYLGGQPRYVSENNVLMPEDTVVPYPNPTTGNLTIRYLVRDDVILTVKLFTPGGKLILQRETKGMFDKINMYNLDLSKFANGVYFLTLTAKSVGTGEEQKLVKKIVILR